MSCDMSVVSEHPGRAINDTGESEEPESGAEGHRDLNKQLIFGVLLERGPPAHTNRKKKLFTGVLQAWSRGSIRRSYSRNEATTLYSKRGPCTSIISSFSELCRNTESQASAQTCCLPIFILENSQATCTHVKSFRSVGPGYTIADRLVGKMTKMKTERASSL